MGRTKIRITPSALESMLQFPRGWQIVSAAIEPLQFNRDTEDLILAVEGPNVEDGAEYQGVYTTKQLDGEDGRWIQGRWEFAPACYGTVDDVKRNWNQPEVKSEGTN